MSVTLQGGSSFPPIEVTGRIESLDPPWELATAIRELTVLVLGQYPAFAGIPIESERVDPVGPNETPRLIVFADVEGHTRVQAGSVPDFDVTMHLVVQATVRRARVADAKADVDAMIAGIKDCLLRQPLWVMQSQRIASFRDSRTSRHEGDKVLFDGRVQIDCVWPEKFMPIITQPLSKITVAIGPSSRPAPETAPPTVAVQPTIDIRSILTRVLSIFT